MLLSVESIPYHHVDSISIALIAKQSHNFRIARIAITNAHSLKVINSEPRIPIHIKLSTMAKLALNNEDNDDIVTINAGGKMFQILRSTLCLPPGDTAFCKLFGKVTATKHTLKETMDENGNFFFDHDPELIEIILNFLRAKKMVQSFGDFFNFFLDLNFGLFWRRASLFL